MDSFDFIQAFGAYLKQDEDRAYVYAGQKPNGLFMLRTKDAHKKYVFKGYTTEQPVIPLRLLNFIAKTPKFKGRKLDNYIFIGYSFSILSCKLPKTNKNISLILLDTNQRKIDIYGAVNLEDGLLESVIEFSEANNFEVSYDFEGQISRSINKKSTKKEVIKSEQREIPPKVFISYSWDSAEHKLWVLKLVSELMRNGIDVLIDEWDLEKYKNDLQFFMEAGIRGANKVIMVCTTNYAQRANQRIGGMGVENTIITGEFYDEINGTKFIPIVKCSNGNITSSLPSYLRTKYYIDFSKEDQYMEKLDELIRKILGIPKYKKPALGKIPSLISEEI
ncbi:toll/interleukin-1 receptor domain-containing protein [uncultured Alistipes sp.]|uniref:toll/interleukin-1 receptor domain-containing protein n=1 Tax=uncultured Alistipes sp. TaxID=538949 RepID=UPI002595B21A|nr:toll/interleukin-1 receptor domain-containing protein [uncultured Alistipes sp.]